MANVKNLTYDEAWTPLFRFIVSYDMCGDMEGLEWAELVLNHALETEKIKDYKVLSSLTGAWGLQCVTFTIDVEVPDVTKWDNSVLDAGTGIANEIVGDSDAVAYGAELLNA